MGAEWLSRVDSTSGATYYVNKITKKSQWTKPLAGSDSKPTGDSDWVSKTDPASGRTYYVNTATKERQWQQPSLHL